MSTPQNLAGHRRGRLALGLGLVCVLLGPALYVAQLQTGRLADPRLVPALATLGTGLVLLALWRRRSIWRILALALVLLVAGFEWWVLLDSSRLPAYAGPVARSHPFPAFRTTRADGTPFTRADLEGDRATAMVFFRGHW